MLSTASNSADVPSVPDYELLRRVGGGAYGEVWLARSRATGALRAAKIVWRKTFEDERPYQREFEGILRFEEISREHPSQLALFHIGRDDARGYFYYVMELADPWDEGERPRQDPPLERPASRAWADASGYRPHTLRADLGQGPLPVQRVLETALALSEALGHLHQRGLTHRDVKPSNVIFVNRRPKLADIGLVTDASDKCSLVGTEGYLPPEGPGTPQADIFALGKVIYEMMTGADRRQFPKLPEDLRAWPEERAILELNEVVLAACARNPDERYRTCDEMRRDLVLLAEGKSLKRKRTTAWYLAAITKLALAGGLAAIVAALLLFRPKAREGPFDPSIYGPDSTNEEATALCNSGLYALLGDASERVGAAYTNFLQSIALDPNFARPYVGLVELRLREDVEIPGATSTTPAEFRAYISQLERLAPRLPAHYVARAALSWSDMNYAEAERWEREAIQANPNYELGHTFYAWLLGCYGRTDEALKELEISRRLAPSKVIVYRSFGNAYYVKRDFTNAIAWYQRAINWEPHHSVAWGGVALCYMTMGKYLQALPFLEKEILLRGADETETKRDFAALRAKLEDADDGGRQVYWQRKWKLLEGETNVFYRKAKICMGLGETNQALNLLEESYQRRERNALETPLNFLIYDACWDPIRGHPRFVRLMEKLHYPDVMRRKD